MQNWQDYVTNIDTNARSKGKNPSLTSSTQPQDRIRSSLAFKIWYGINIVLTALCILALCDGISRASVEHSGLIGTLRATSITFYLPGMLIAGLLGDGYISEQFLLQVQICSLVLAILLVINFILALISYYRHRRDNNPHRRVNLILSTIPVVLVIITLLVRLGFLSLPRSSDQAANAFSIFRSSQI